MEQLEKANNIIKSSQDVLIFPPKKLRENYLEAVFGFSYTLKKFQKNVNLATVSGLQSPNPNKDNRIEKDNKDFIISVDTSGKEVKKMYYEKDNSKLRIHLDLSKGELKKNDLFLEKSEEAINMEADLIVTLGIKALEEFGSFLEKNFKFFYETPILNIDNQIDNQRFGKVNLIYPRLSLENILINLSNYINDKNKTYTFLNVKFWGRVLENLNFHKDKGVYVVTLKNKDFQETRATSKDIAPIIRELKFNPSLLIPQLLFLWEGHSSPIEINGLFYSSSQKLVENISKKFKGETKREGTLFKTKENSLDLVKKEILKLI